MSEEKRTFTYDEAAALLPEVKRLTEEAHHRIETLSASPSGGAAAQAQTRADEVVTEWARVLMSKGIEVKGLWLVDFDNGAGYYCWRYPEEGLQYFHSYEDGFQGRTRIH